MNQTTPRPIIHPSRVSFSDISRSQWNTLFAAQAGWMLDAMDAMLYSFALTTLMKEFSLSSTQAGSVASATLLTAAIGGIGFGI